MGFLNKIPRKNQNLAWRIIDGEAVVILLEDNPKERLDIFNETATRIWELIDGKNSVRDIIKKILGEYDIDYDEVQTQIKFFLNTLSNKKFIALNFK